MSGQFVCYDRNRPETPAVMSNSLGDKTSLILWDLRQKSLGVVKMHQPAPLLTCSWNTKQVYQLLCGSTEGNVLLWDMRKHSSNAMNEPIKQFKYHSKPVTCVRWSPHLSNVFATGSSDMSMTLVNAEKEVIGTTLDDTALIFRHFAHYAPIKQIAWHPRIPGVIASIASTNHQESSVQIWKPNLWFLKGSAVVSV
ncbi:WD40-repeat-containing domain protein [Syncephalis fuscata]|nr:WD40-repeat-containing domain protein [Syncephalis fuscata]